MNESVHDKLAEALAAAGIKSREDRLFLSWTAYIEMLHTLTELGLKVAGTRVGHYGSVTVVTLSVGSLSVNTSLRWFLSEDFKQRHIQEEKNFMKRVSGV